MEKPADQSQRREFRRQRWELLRQVSRILEPPMIGLAFVWLALLIYEFVLGFHPVVQFLSYGIWGVFILDFAIRFLIAPSKRRYLRSNWLTLLALLLPALRVARLFQVVRAARIARAARSLRLVRLLTSLNRSIGAARRTLAKRGVGYVLAVTVIVALAGAAGMLAFENRAALEQAGYQGTHAGLNTYGEALWWTAMVLTTMGSEYWPHTAEGRILTLLLALYAFAVFGYITATIASHFVGRDVERETESERRIERELAGLRAEIERQGTRKGGA